MVPSGSVSGRPGLEYVFSSSCVDPDGDDLFYLWDFGDGNFSGWLGPFDSGGLCNVSYVWVSRGVFEVRVKARDVFGLEGVWSDSLVVSMPKNKFNINLKNQNFYTKILEILIYNINYDKKIHFLFNNVN